MKVGQQGPAFRSPPHFVVVHIVNYTHSHRQLYFAALLLRLIEHRNEGPLLLHLNRLRHPPEVKRSCIILYKLFKSGHPGHQTTSLNHDSQLFNAFRSLFHTLSLPLCSSSHVFSTISIPVSSFHDEIQLSTLPAVENPRL